MRTITVKGTGNVSAKPDYIILTLNIEALSEPMTAQCRKLPRGSKKCKVPQSALGITRKT